MGLFILFAILVATAMVAMIIWNNTPRRYTSIDERPVRGRPVRGRRIDLMDPAVDGGSETTVVETRRRVNRWD